MMNKASLDTMIMIWGIKREAIPEQFHKIEWAKTFIDSLEKSNSKIFISSVVLGELLCKVPPEKRKSLLKEIHRRFMVIPFDASSSLEYANVYYTKKVEPSTVENLEGMIRQHIKADIMIVASSVAANMSVLYTEDDSLAKIADGFIPVYPMYKVETQLSLLDQPTITDSDDIDQT